MRRTAAVGYAGQLASLKGHLEARVDYARRIYAERPTHPNEIDLVQAEEVLERFIQRHGNGEAA